MKTNDDVTRLLERVDRITKEKKLDLSSGEDLSIAVMNLISIEEHLFFTSQKTGKKEYVGLLGEVRDIRRELLGLLVKGYEGEVWCIEKHLLAATMRLIEVGTKYLSEGKKNQAHDLFSKAYKLYSLFWGINLKIVKVPARNAESIASAGGDQVEQAGRGKNEIRFFDGETKLGGKVSVLDKLGTIVKRAIDCCRE